MVNGSYINEEGLHQVCRPYKKEDNQQLGLLQVQMTWGGVGGEQKAGAMCLLTGPELSQLAHLLTIVPLAAFPKR